MSIIVECYTCHQLTTEQNMQPIRLLTPTGRFRNGVEILRASKNMYECDACLNAEFETGETPTHIYTVHSCGITRTIGAATPEEAAVLMLRDRGWRSTRSVAVQTGNVWCEYLDCELVGGQLQYSERVDLP